ncbi:MAG TPA: hypothetical protein VLM39_04400 [Ignavibacteriaceae bacterium]|nr:hypothetical protein [Ignavibacteriaceae bacterium]
MGQQQLLLIVLGVILVGVAVVLGIQYFSVGAEEGAKDELVAHTLTVGANAQQWYKKPVAMGGGGNTFTGFNTHFTDDLTRLHTSTNGVYTTAAEGTTSINIIGTPASNLNYLWVVTTTVYLDSMVTVIN